MTDNDDLPLFQRRQPPLHRKHEPSLTPGDMKRLGGKKRQILGFLIAAHQVPGGWVHIDALRSIGGSSGDRRARELRAYGLSIEVVRDQAAPDNGIWNYRLRPDSLEAARDLLEKTRRGR